MPAGPEISASFALLERLAATLDIPVDTFLPGAADSNDPPPATLAEPSSLLAAFSQITCPIERRRCLDFVQAAGRSEETS